VSGRDVPEVSIEFLDTTRMSCRVRPLARDQPSMPAQNCVWRHDRRDLPQHTSAQAPPALRKTTALFVADPQSRPASRLRSVRFSSIKYAMTSCCWWSSQPDRAARKIRTRVRSTTPRVYAAGPSLGLAGLLGW